MKKENSIRVSYGMFISSLIIVIHHSVGHLYWENGLFGNMIIKYFHEEIFMFTMPFFFFWSGFFLFRNVDKKSYYEILQNKKKSLLVPYLSWNILWTLISVILYFQPVQALKDNYDIAWDGNITNIVKGLFLFKYNGQYWYMLQLLIMVIFCKVLYSILKNKKRFVCCLIILAIILHFKYSIYYFSIEGLIFFLLGGYIAIYYYKKDKIILKLEKIINRIPVFIYLILLLLITIMLTIINVNIGNIADVLIKIILLVCFWECLRIVQNRKVYSWMENYFFLYSFHETPQLIINKVISLIIPFSGFLATSINTVMGIVITFMLSEIFSNCLKKRVPFIWEMLNGSRKKINAK